ncbi:MAG: DNA repair protein RecN [Acutalibacteraceae bacterium]|nr:DNA repair protein RecN [Acutalibacteraceae bacterium]
MLSSLIIENVAIIEYAEIFFDGGLNILTGETGAGKSIIIDSINAILGERTSKDLVRHGSDKAKITAFFEDLPEDIISTVSTYDIDCDDGSLLITRVISADGRGNCKINGCPVTVSMLKDIGRNLISICGQHDSQYLLQKEQHITFVDKIADCYELLDDYKETYTELKDAHKKLRALNKNEDNKERQLEFLKYQIDEITDADIKIGEYDNLLAEKKRILAREKISNSLKSAEYLINGDENSGGIKSSLYDLIKLFDEIAEYNSDFKDLSNTLNELIYVVEDSSDTVSASLYQSDSGNGDINAVEQRLDKLYRIMKKYGSTEIEVQTYLDKITDEYNNIIFSDELKEKLFEEISVLEDELFKRGCYLSDSRKNAAINFEKRVCDELKFLDMPDAIFVVNFIDANAMENGMDEVEFLFSANSGQEPRPLQKIASGGELSRVMLAIRCVLSEYDSLSTMIFDEIDTGVSGRAAHKIAYKMSCLSKNKQVLCVTHLAQIAAYADNHLYIEKKAKSGKTYTHINSLDDNERINEIARIIGGDVITQKTLDSAGELLSFAKEELN